MYVRKCCIAATLNLVRHSTCDKAAILFALLVYRLTDLQDRRLLSANGIELQKLQSRIRSIHVSAEAHITEASRQLTSLTRRQALEQLESSLRKAYNVCQGVEQALLQLAEKCSRCSLCKGLSLCSSRGGLLISTASEMAWQLVQHSLYWLTDHEKTFALIKS